jgi:hypothetical protein
MPSLSAIASRVKPSKNKIIIAAVISGGNGAGIS